MSVIHMTYEEIQPSSYAIQPVEKVDNFKEILRAAILFFRMRLISVPEKLTSQ